MEEEGEGEEEEQGGRAEGFADPDLSTHIYMSDRFFFSLATVTRNE